MRDLFENDSRALARAERRGALRNIVRRIGGKVAAAATGLAESHLSKALSDDPGDRYLRDEHEDALLALATPAEVTAVLDARLRAYGRRSRSVEPRNWQERHARLAYLVATKLGSVGVEIVEQEEAESV